jgi:transcription elongation factor B subunit 2
MDVFLMVRRKKTTIFLDAKETTTVLDLKKMIEGITKKSPSDQQIYNKDDVGRLYILVLSNAKRKEVS